MSTFTVVLALVLAAAFVGAGGTKLANMGPHEEEFRRYALPGLRPALAQRVVGGVELLASLLLLLAALTRSVGLAWAGGLLVVILMVGAVSTHLRLRDPALRLLPALTLGALAVLFLLFR